MDITKNIRLTKRIRYCEEFFRECIIPELNLSLNKEQIDQWIDQCILKGMIIPDKLDRYTLSWPKIKLMANKRVLIDESVLREVLFRPGLQISNDVNIELWIYLGIQKANIRATSEEYKDDLPDESMVANWYKSLINPCYKEFEMRREIKHEKKNS